MVIEPGTRLGPYEILAPLAAGGMGDVYRARDTRLDREVALKALPPTVAGDSSALMRFEREAKAVAALSHPNILALHDFGREGETAWVVTELLEGETLRQRLEEGALPSRKAVDLGRQIARGLAAAHDKGIVHRDLKPENVFVTREGRAKILDFGLARTAADEAADGGIDSASDQTPTRTHLTSPGMVVGTAAYMSPEQVRAQPVDHRSDIFSFGALLHETLTGRPAFSRDSAADTLAAVLREDPAEQQQDSSVNVPPAVARVVHRCLEKQPEERFQSARDLAFALENALGTSGTSGIEAVLEEDTSSAARPARHWWPWLVAAALLVVGLLVGRMMSPSASAEWDYTELTYRQGSIHSARFDPEGRRVIYTANWDGEGTHLFSTQAASPQSQALGLADAELLSVSSAGELALLLDIQPLIGYMRRGTLARMPIGGGAPREMLHNIQTAEWHPTEDDLAVVVVSEERVYRLEYPPGNSLYEAVGWLNNVRFAPDGRHIAFADHPARGDSRGRVAVVDLQGNKRDLTEDYSNLSGVAWSAAGDEIWFTAGVRGTKKAIYAITLGGRLRVVTRAPADLRLFDISREGRVILARENASRGMVALPPGATAEVPLSWLDWGFPTDVTDDGETVLFTEQGEGGGPGYTSYLRPTRGGPAVRLAPGQSLTISGDGERVLIRPIDDRSVIYIYRTGAGERRRVDTRGLRVIAADFLDEEHLFVVGSPEDQPMQGFVLDLDNGPPQPVTPPGVDPNLTGPAGDGSGVIARLRDGPILLYPFDGGEPRPLKGVEPGEAFAGRSADGRHLYLVSRSTMLPTQVFRLDPRTGERELLLELFPSAPAGLTFFGPVFVFADGEGYLYSYRRVLSTLYLAEPI